MGLTAILTLCTHILRPEVNIVKVQAPDAHCTFPKAVTSFQGRSMGSKVA
jgi:hypothetical protein